MRLKKHHLKIIDIAGYSNSELLNIEDKVYKPISFISEIHLPLSVRKYAERMVKEVDPKDTVYIAFAK